MLNVCLKWAVFQIYIFRLISSVNCISTYEIKIYTIKKISWSLQVGIRWVLQQPILILLDSKIQTQIKCKISKEWMVDQLTLSVVLTRNVHWLEKICFLFANLTCVEKWRRRKLMKYLCICLGQSRK